MDLFHWRITSTKTFLKESPEMTLEQAQKESSRVKAYFPYRVVYIAETAIGEFSVGSGKTKARATNELRKGAINVWIIS